MNLAKKFAYVVTAATLSTTGLIGIAGSADALPGTVCMTHQQFFHALSNREQRALYRGGKLTWGVSYVRCAGRWAAAEVQTRTNDPAQPAEADTATEHRSAAGNWYQIGRVKPCKMHRIPTEIRTQFCDSN